MNSLQMMIVFLNLACQTIDFGFGNIVNSVNQLFEIECCCLFQGEEHFCR